jgi:hypothetical protein
MLWLVRLLAALLLARGVPFVLSGAKALAQAIGTAAAPSSQGPRSAATTAAAAEPATLGLCRRVSAPDPRGPVIQTITYGSRPNILRLTAISALAMGTPLPRRMSIGQWAPAGAAMDSRAPPVRPSSSDGLYKTVVIARVVSGFEPVTPLVFARSGMSRPGLGVANALVRGIHPL